MHLGKIKKGKVIFCLHIIVEYEVPANLKALSS